MTANEKTLAKALLRMLCVYDVLLEHAEVEYGLFDAKELKELSEAPTQALEALHAVGIETLSHSVDTMPGHH